MNRSVVIFVQFDGNVRSHRACVHVCVCVSRKKIILKKNDDDEHSYYSYEKQDPHIKKVFKRKTNFHLVKIVYDGDAIIMFKC